MAYFPGGHRNFICGLGAILRQLTDAPVQDRLVSLAQNLVNSRSSRILVAVLASVKWVAGKL
jgi:hypothetical protein